MKSSSSRPRRLPTRLAAADFTAQKRQFTSKINGQFSLKYRLVEALSHYTRGSGTLKERQPRRPYGERRARHLVKADNLLNVVDRYLAGATADQCSFVALTDDTQNPWPVVAARRQTLLRSSASHWQGVPPRRSGPKRQHLGPTRRAFRVDRLSDDRGTAPPRAPLQPREALPRGRAGAQPRARDSRRHLHPSPATEEVVGVSAADAQPPRTAAQSAKELLEKTRFRYKPRDGSDTFDPGGYAVMKLIDQPAYEVSGSGSLPWHPSAQHLLRRRIPPAVGHQDLADSTAWSSMWFL